MTDTTDPDIYVHLRHTLAEAFRNTAKDCDGNCGLTEEECFSQHPLQVFSIHFGEIGTVIGDVEELANTVIRALYTNEKHVYFSTSCLHDDHGYCQQQTGNMGLKNPGECKFCNRPCQCTCHDTTRKGRPA